MHRRDFLLAAGLALPALSPAAPALARQVMKFAEELKNGEFNWFPERSPTGPVLVVVSIPEQRVHVYRNGIRIAASSCSTGKKGHETPTGVFTILQKDKFHKSKTYDDAPMPNMNRLTWDGIALHAGNLPGYPASHGCVRLPMEFSELLFGITQLGMTVILADDRSFPPAIAHPGLLLDDSALGTYRAAETSVLKREYMRRGDPPDRITGVVVSSADQQHFRAGKRPRRGAGRDPLQGQADPARRKGLHARRIGFRRRKPALGEDRHRPAGTEDGCQLRSRSPGRRRPA